MRVTILLLTLLAGCTAPTETRALPASPPAEVTSINFDITGYNTPFAGGGSNNPNGGPVDVAENATRILMEARWSCPAGPCALRLFLFDPDHKATDFGTGDGEGSFAIDEPGPGTWNAQVQSDTGATKATGEIRVTVFYGDVPADYSAFDA